MKLWQKLELLDKLYEIAKCEDGSEMTPRQKKALKIADKFFDSVMMSKQKALKKLLGKGYNKLDTLSYCFAWRFYMFDLQGQYYIVDLKNNKFYLEERV